MKIALATVARRAFTLLEVMIAVAIFFVAVFSILGLVSNSLANARRLNQPVVDASPVAGFLAQTNILVEGTYQRDLGDPDLLGPAYRGYVVKYEVREIATNRLFNVDFAVQSRDPGRPVVSQWSTLYYKPDSPPGSLDGGNFIHR
jgi:hypothetical protein